jgi:hypothetical protein
MTRRTNRSKGVKLWLFGIFLPAPSQSFAQLVYLLLKSWFLSHSLLKFLANRLSRQRATFSVGKGEGDSGGSLYLLFRGTAR